MRDLEVPKSLTALLYEWENARAHLAKAIGSYASVTTALQAATTSHPLWALDYPTSTLEDELESLSLGLSELDKVRVVLASTRNTQCAPISRLPPELLASIFQIVVDDAYPRNIRYSAGYTNPATKLVRVCSRWRQVALQVGSLWSCVVFLYQADNHEYVSATARLQLERTHGSPIDLFLTRWPNRAPDKNEGEGEDGHKPQSILDLVKPYMKQIRSLVLRSVTNKQIECFLESCTINGAAGSLSRLGIFGAHAPYPLFYQADSHTLERLDEYLRSVRTLDLHGATFPWRCAVFEQLGGLVLDSLYPRLCPNVMQLVEVLSASPGLRYLSLKNSIIHGKMEPADRSPVRLDHLEKLTLDRLGDSGFCRAVSVLSLGQSSPDITVNADFNCLTTLSALRRFSQENCIQVFRFMGISDHQPLHDILKSLPDLKHFTLCGLKLGQSDLDALVHRNSMPSLLPSPPPIQTDSAFRLPRLEGLALMRCTIICDQATFKKAVLSLSLDFLNLYQCSIKVRKESDGGPSGGRIANEALDIDGTTELGIWLTRNVIGQVEFSS
ncbi:hypothetical protein BDV93DRAFT_546632 [Ceratobasidium sp. AG-I]|nr:hypothetical protein BDV93DRAFT_546632 [Ceratobasidium sp. AG-I]